MAAGEIETQWFARHGSTPITEIPAHWPEAYRQVVERRIEIIERRRDIALIERPECKRRWQSEPWEKKERAALRAWLLDRCEDRALWFALDDTGTEQPRPMTVNRLADRLRADADFVSVARLYAGPDAGSGRGDRRDHRCRARPVPGGAALQGHRAAQARGSGKRTWDLQRQEDATGKRLDIPVPPKYTSRRLPQELVLVATAASWTCPRSGSSPTRRRARTATVRCCSAGRAGITGEQAHALMTIIEERATRDGWDTRPADAADRGAGRGACRGCGSGTARWTRRSA